MVEISSKNTHWIRRISVLIVYCTNDEELTEESRHQETLDLDPFSSKNFDRKYRRVIPGYEAKGSDDHASSRYLEETFPRSTGGSVIADLLENDVLVEIDAVKAVEGIQ